MRQISGLIALALVVAGFPSVAGAQDKTAEAKPIGNPAEWFGGSSYPKEAVRAQAQGRAIAEVAVDAHGSPTGCKIATSAGNADLDRVTCDLAMTRGRFTPARDARGREVPSTFILPVRWVLPDRQGPATSFSVTDRMEIAPDGALVSCEATDKLPDSNAPDTSCDMFREPEAGLTLALRGGEIGGIVTAYFQFAMTMDDNTPPPEAHLAKGRVVVGVARAKIDIAPDGIVTSCRAVENAGGLGSYPLCELMAGPFEPETGALAGKNRSATLLAGFSYEARKP